MRESSGGFESTFTAREKARHGTKRRLLSQAFSERALKDYEPRIVSLIRTWVNCIEDEVEKGTSSINIGKWGDYLVFDILGNLCFGKAFGVMTSAKDRPTVSLVSEATEGWYRVSELYLTIVILWSAAFLTTTVWVSSTHSCASLSAFQNAFWPPCRWQVF